MHSSFVRRALLGVAALCVVTLGAVPTAFGAPPTVVTAMERWSVNELLP